MPMAIKRHSLVVVNKHNYNLLKGDVTQIMPTGFVSLPPKSEIGEFFCENSTVENR